MTLGLWKTFTIPGATAEQRATRDEARAWASCSPAERLRAAWALSLEKHAPDEGGGDDGGVARVRPRSPAVRRRPVFRDLLAALAEAEARFVVVGAYAVAFYGRPRATKDLDLFIEATPENAARMVKALAAFGAPFDPDVEADLATPGAGLVLGKPPRCVDLLTKMDGISFERAFENRAAAVVANVPWPVIAFEALLENKAATGRPSDLADIAAIVRARCIAEGRL